MSHPGFVAACLLALWATAAFCGQVPPAGQGTESRPAAGAIEPGVQRATPVGASACASCHAEIHAAWKGGRHSRMIQPATAATVLGDFSQTRLTLHGKPYRLRAANGELYITESSLTGKPQEHHVDYTLGSRRIQHYLTTIDSGRIIVLPPSWDVQRQRVVRQHGHRPARTKTTGTPVQQWNKNCVGCHVSQQDNNYRPATRNLRDGVDRLRHLVRALPWPRQRARARYSRSRAAATGDRAIVRPTRLDPGDEQHDLRAVPFAARRRRTRLHRRRGLLRLLHAAARVRHRARNRTRPTGPTAGRGVSRTTRSGCGRARASCKGGATCTTCHHDPHLPDVDQNPQLAPRNNALCTQCHAAIGAALTAHTRHAAGSAGSSCVECHMPKTVVSIKATMRDHTIGLPAPENTVAFGIPNACTECHTHELGTVGRRGDGEMVAERTQSAGLERAAAFSAARSGKPEALPRLLAIAGDADQGPLMQANALGYLRNYPDARAQSTLIEALGAEHPLLVWWPHRARVDPALKPRCCGRWTTRPGQCAYPRSSRWSTAASAAGSGSRSLRARQRRVRRAGKDARRRSGDPGRPRTGAPAEWRSRTRLAGADECSRPSRRPSAGASVINVPDTVGYTGAEGVRRVGAAGWSSSFGRRAIVSTHCHNESRPRHGEHSRRHQAGSPPGRGPRSTGLGERAGNASLEEVVMALRTRAG